MRRRKNSLDFRHQSHWSLNPLIRISKITGPIAWLNPTRIKFQNTASDEYDQLEQSSSSALFSRRRDGARHIAFQWTARNDRKGRHLLLISPTRSVFEQSLDKQYASRTWAITVGILRMLTHFPLWDVSYLLALIFSVGSAIWLVDGVILFLPYVGVDQLSGHANAAISGIAAFAGTSIFALGNLILVLEAINDLSGHCSGWTVSQNLDSKRGLSAEIRPGHCGHRHSLVKQHLLDHSIHLPLPGFIPRQVRQNAVGKDVTKKPTTGQLFQNQYHAYSWRWLPTLHELCGHYIYEIGFLGCGIQLSSALIFYLGSITRLIGIYCSLSRPVSIALLWLPKFIGSIGFITSGFLFMVETQTYWLRPAPLVIGWHIGVWSLLGGIAFALSSCFGVITWSTWTQYSSSLATFCGGVAFLIASLLQWFESLQKYTIQVENLGNNEGFEAC